jgi:drug/metabolite transporter (DMT)-like permease
MRISDRPQAMGIALGLIGVTDIRRHLADDAYRAWRLFPLLHYAIGRAVIASIAAGLTLLLMRKKWPKGQGAILLGAGICVVYGFPIFSTTAMQTIPASHGGVILGILPLLTSIFAALVDGERPGPAFWAYGLAGAALVAFFSIRDSGFVLQMGDAWLFLAAITASLGYVLSAKVSRILPGWEVISWALVITAPLSIVAALLVMKDGIQAPTHAELGALSYLGLMSMFGGFIFWNAGLALGGIARVAQVQLLQTFVTLAVSAVLLGETISPSTIGFAVAVALIVWLGRKARIA